jgi:hypothetical protein
MRLAPPRNRSKLFSRAKTVKGRSRAFTGTDSWIKLDKMNLILNEARTDHVERARDVFTDAQRFEVLTKKIESLTEKERQIKQTVLEALDELIKFSA